MSVFECVYVLFIRMFINGLSYEAQCVCISQSIYRCERICKSVCVGVCVASTNKSSWIKATTIQ